MQMVEQNEMQDEVLAAYHNVLRKLTVDKDMPAEENKVVSLDEKNLDQEDAVRSLEVFKSISSHLLNLKAAVEQSLQQINQLIAECDDLSQLKRRYDLLKIEAESERKIHLQKIAALEEQIQKYKQL